MELFLLTLALLYSSLLIKMIYEQRRNQNCYILDDTCFTLALLFSSLLIKMIYEQRRNQNCYILDYTCFRPSDDCELNTDLIPAEIGSLQTLVEFSGSGNRLSGSIPKTIGKLELLGRLDLHNNELSGEIPAEIRSCKKLSELNLAENELSGQIPPGIGYLPVLNYLDLSENRLTGEIPIELQNLKLNRFNLSSNRLSGKLPPMYATEMYRESFLGNPGLCGDLQELCSESQRCETKSHKLLWLLRSIFILAGLVLVVGVGWFCWRYQNFKKVKRDTDRKPLAVLTTSGVDLSCM